MIVKSSFPVGLCGPAGHGPDYHVPGGGVCDPQQFFVGHIPEIQLPEGCGQPHRLAESEDRIEVFRLPLFEDELGQGPKSDEFAVIHMGFKAFVDVVECEPDCVSRGEPATFETQAAEKDVCLGNCLDSGAGDSCLGLRLRMHPVV